MPAVSLAQQAKSKVNIRLFGVHQPRECEQPLHAVLEEIDTLPYPAGWTLAVMCTSTAWEAARTIADNPRTDTAFTVLSRKLTVLNGAISHHLRLEYRHTIAHELGHVACNGADEGKAEAAAYALERSSPEEVRLATSSPQVTHPPAPETVVTAPPEH